MNASDFKVGFVFGAIFGVFVFGMGAMIVDPWKDWKLETENQIMSACDRYGWRVFTRDDGTYTMKCSSPEFKSVQPWEK